ncbi:hypothetical protein QWY75_13140 [Pontixanthobacter aestiaquae]|uniref:Uncharacterized protein n=1 Tax=Pontixanthobacter aestiaquae TaxID=1509367 RepID=A0A844Z513_9SPHN|nr:hypothetical protein [Pontixanthobacter aestiaquae]MDN3647151.1 hypothetical protein [Pontixanthobacter aestiaquae]MXO81873.1 hypothetical protein [Pontixanthobacter aestiaquae]
MKSVWICLAALGAVFPLSAHAQEPAEQVTCDDAMVNRITATADSLSRNWNDEQLGAIANVRDQCMENPDIALGFGVALFHRTNAAQLTDAELLETLHLIWNEVLRIGTLDDQVERQAVLSELAQATMTKFLSFSEAHNGSTSTFFSQPSAAPQNCPPSETTIAIRLAENYTERGGGHQSGFLKALATACNNVPASRRAPIVWYGSHIKDRTKSTKTPEEKTALLNTSVAVIGNYLAGETAPTTESLAQSTLKAIAREMQDLGGLPDPTEAAFWEGRDELNAFRTLVVGRRIGEIWVDLEQSGEARTEEIRERIQKLHAFVKALDTATAPHGDSARAAAYEAFVRHKDGEFDKPRLTKWAKSKFVPPPEILYKPLKPNEVN